MEHSEIYIDSSEIEILEYIKSNKELESLLRDLKLMPWQRYTYDFISEDIMYIIGYLWMKLNKGKEKENE